MSYLLDALRKAERERNVGQTPDITHPARTITSVRTRRWPRLPWRPIGIVVSLVVLGAILGWRALRTPPDVTASPIAAAPASATSMSAAEIARTGDSPAQLNDLLDPEVQVNTLPIEAQRELSETPPESATPAPTAAVAEASAPVPSRVAPKTAPVAAPIESPAEPAAPTMAEQAAAAPEPPPEVMPLKQMAPDYRGSFPKVRIDVHVYDDDASRRFVMVNGRKYREGETLAEGPNIVSINPDGVVLRYNSQEVLIPILSH